MSNSQLLLSNLLVERGYLEGQGRLYLGHSKYHKLAHNKLK